MSQSLALQDGVIALLKADPTLVGLIGGRVYDEPPKNPEFPYIDLGPSDFRPGRADELLFRVDTLQIDVWCETGGKKWPCRQIVDAVYAALDGIRPDLAAPYACTRLDVVLARVSDDPDPAKVHGIIQIEAGIETVGG
jgi:hypothetical protein